MNTLFGFEFFEKRIENVFISSEEHMLCSKKLKIYKIRK